MDVTSPKRRWWENVLFLVVAIGMLAFVTNSYVLEQKVFKQRTLYYQLMLLRSAINTYKLVENKNPDSLLVLAVETYKIPGENHTYRYIERFPINAANEVADSFGNPYVYDNARGWVMSSTPGYELW